nr:YdgA family protein [Pseudomonadota bacterium]
EYDNKNASNQVIMLQLFPLLMDLLQKGFSINLSPVALNTSWGAINGGLKINVAESKSTILDFNSLLNKITAEGQLKFPASLLQYTLTMLSSPDSKMAPNDYIQLWLLAGWLAPDGNNYSVNLHFKENELQINGKMLKIPTLPLPGLPGTTQDQEW